PRKEAGGIEGLSRTISELGMHTVRHMVVHFIDPVEQMILLGNAYAPQYGISGAIEETKHRSTTRHSETQHQEQDQCQPPGALHVQCLPKYDRLRFTPLQPVAYFCSKEKHRRPQQAEVHKGHCKGQENT